MPPHPLPNFEMQKFHQKEPKFNGVYSRNNLSKIKVRAYIINLDQYESIGTHWIALHVNAENVTYFVSFGVEHILKEIIKLIGNKNIIANILMRGYFCIDFMLKGKSLLEYTNYFLLMNIKRMTKWY